MTCIVGLVDSGKVYIGGDSAGVDGYSLTQRADQKVFRNGEFLMGFTTSFRMGDILKYAFEPPKIDTWDLWRYMATDFVDAARAAFKSKGYTPKSEDSEAGGTFLVGVKGQLFKVDSDWQIGIPSRGFDACGCGMDLAIGAMYATIGKAPTERVRIALEAAEAFSAGVRGPFAIESQ